MNGRNRSSQSLSTSAECTPAASAHTQSRRSCASWAATLGWVEAGRLGASSWLQALGSPRPRRARETVTRRERPPRQSAVAVQARGGWAAQGVKKRCRLPPVVDGLSALPQRQLDLGGVFPARSARSPASPTRVAVESRSGAIPRAPRPRAGGWRWARRGGWSFSYGEKGYEGREPQVPWGREPARLLRRFNTPDQAVGWSRLEAWVRRWLRPQARCGSRTLLLGVLLSSKRAAPIAQRPALSPAIERPGRRLRRDGSTPPRAPMLQCPANPCWDRVSRTRL